MQRLFAAMCFVILGLFCGCSDLGEQPVTLEIDNMPGTVLELFPQFYVIQCDVPLQIAVQTFYPRNLPEAFRKNGLRVRFSGNIESGAGMDYLYVPVTLVSIELLLFELRIDAVSKQN